MSGVTSRQAGVTATIWRATLESRGQRDNRRNVKSAAPEHHGAKEFTDEERLWRSMRSDRTSKGKVFAISSRESQSQHYEIAAMYEQFTTVAIFRDDKSNMPRFPHPPLPSPPICGLSLVNSFLVVRETLPICV